MLDLLHGMQEADRSWDDAVTELATKLHSYYTTPLGIVMRQDMFGDQAVFFTPDVYAWTERQRGENTGDGED